MARAQQDWAQAAPGWDRHTPLIRAWLHAPTQAMLDAAQITLRARVLDVAAGAGDQTLDIAQRVGPQGYVLATDVSEEILGYAQTRLNRAGIAWAETEVADAQAHDWGSEKFDAVICRLGLMFCNEPGLALAHFYAALKPHGRFAALVFDGPAHNPCLTLPVGIARKYAGHADREFFAPPRGSLMSLGDARALSDMLVRAGFEDVAVRTISAPFYASSLAEYLDFLQTAASPILQILAPLSAGAQQQAWGEIASALDQYSAPQYWCGPKQLLLCSGARG